MVPPRGRGRSSTGTGTGSCSTNTFGATTSQGMAGNAQNFNIGTPQRERAPYDHNWMLDGKIASLPTFQYDSKDTASWLLKVKNYLTGQCPDLEYLLKWAEDHQHQELTQAEVKSCGLVLDVDPVQASQRIWTWLQMPLMGSGSPELDYNNTETLNGLEIWRKLAVPQASKSRPRRYALRDRIQNPKPCASFGAVLEQLKGWHKDLTAYVAAGGTMPEVQFSEDAARHPLSGNEDEGS